MNNEMKLIARELAKMGRNGDTMLAHINPQEAAILKMLGGSGTINPNTGLPEYWGIKSVVKAVKNVVKAVAPVAAVVVAIVAPELIPAIGSSILGTSAATAGIAEIAAGAAALSGTTTLAATGDIEKAAKAAATAAVSVGVGGNVAQVVGESVAAAGLPESAAKIAASTVGAASSAAATGGNVETAAAQGFLGSVGKIAYTELTTQPPAPIETRTPVPTDQAVADLIQKEAQSIAATPAGEGVQVAAAPTTTATDVTAPTTGALKVTTTGVPYLKESAPPDLQPPEGYRFATSEEAESGAAGESAVTLPNGKMAWLVPETTPPVEAAVTTPSAGADVIGTTITPEVTPPVDYTSGALAGLVSPTVGGIVPSGTTVLPETTPTVAPTPAAPLPPPQAAPITPPPPQQRPVASVELFNALGRDFRQPVSPSYDTFSNYVAQGMQPVDAYFRAGFDALAKERERTNQQFAPSRSRFDRFGIRGLEPSGLPTGEPTGVPAGVPGGEAGGVPTGVPSGEPAGMGGGIGEDMGGGIAPDAGLPAEPTPVEPTPVEPIPEEPTIEEVPGEEIPPEEIPAEEKPTGTTRYGVSRFPYYPSAGTHALRAAGLLGPSDLTSAGIAPVERRRKEMGDEESTQEPTGTWGSQTLRGLLGI